MEILKILKLEETIREAINESQINIGVIRLIIKDLYNDIDKLYYQYLQQIQQQTLENEGEENGSTDTGNNNNS